MKQGTKVRFKARTQSGTGVIAAITESGRGLWYTVKIDGSDKTIKVRAANLSAI